MSGYSKKDVNLVIRRIKYLLRNHAQWIIFKKLRGMCALYEKEGAHGPVRITIDHRKDLISSLIHEALHHWHPNWSESKVIKHENMIMNAMTPFQAKNIMKVWGQNI